MLFTENLLSSAKGESKQKNMVYHNIEVWHMLRLSMNTHMNFINVFP